MLIGPRSIFYRDIDGNEGVIKIEIELRPPTYTTLDDGTLASDHHGAALITSDIITRRIEFVGVDDCQVAFRALWISDVAVQSLARDLGLTIWALVEGDIKDDFDVYKA